ncbi:DUF4209 domain-containing protein [Vibrio cholerae]|uniref:DUF4209 domain-containing protein n=1 Tax=Vibrio cholerae TaxID=666 RepID=UPI0004E45E55|nr:DUF4209 domain-containing protein [Vibrio cholerae]EGQ8411906.1 DUF4209 domain-containing protein [Vibrio cholerae]EGR0540346.1 DUF4209 domain-containing protein [Vibrio cholerae]EGR1045236.1 DUF4209 domain-containing protein [Vibrio cholerae]EGR1090806.1 DUF4209 domain-containing protein [Vibrio cholerae]EGR1310054.1 DUF4209 domain-containing protein [Vibrio cholerae]
MSLHETVVTLEELQGLNLAAILSEVEENSYHYIESALAAQRESTPARLLAAACSMHFTPRDAKVPFKPKFIFEDRRGLIASDFSEESLTALKDFCPEVENHELRARLADIAWITKSGNIEHAYIAIEAYLESAKQLADESDSWVLPYERIERALRLSCMFRRDNQRPELFDKVSQFLLEQYEAHKESDRCFYAKSLLTLCLEFGIKEDNWIYEQALVLARLLFERGDYDSSINANQIALDAAISMRNKEKQIATWQSISECHVKAAEDYQQGMIAAGRLLKAIDALAKVPGTKEKRLALYEEMREQQIESLHELDLIVTDGQDISQLVNTAIAKVQSVDLFDALFRLGTITRPSNIERLRQHAVEQMQTSISWIFGTTHLDHEGMTTAVIPAGLGIKDDENGLRCWSIMMRNIGIEHQLVVEGQIMPALNEVTTKYVVVKEAIEQICSNHPFIPDGHEEYFVKGLLAGFNRDFMTACHLLVPQIENSLRYLARQKGEEPSTLHGDGSQERNGIKALLGHQAIIDTLGSDLTTNLQVVLLDKLYGDLRNQLSHGYVPASTYWGTAPKFLWWLVLHIVMIPYARQWKEHYKQEIRS